MVENVLIKDINLFESKYTETFIKIKSTNNFANRARMYTFANAKKVFLLRACREWSRSSAG